MQGANKVQITILKDSRERRQNDFFVPSETGLSTGSIRHDMSEGGLWGMPGSDIWLYLPE